MKCPKCQTENPETRKFCKECGAKFVLICPHCDFPNTPGDKFCGECGRPLTKPAETLPIDYTNPQSYTPRSLAQKILTQRSAVEGERKLLTVLFADVASYTPMSEKLDPERVHQIMDGCFRIMLDEIHKYEGTINKFTGDGAMALFGAPIAHEDHAQRACHAALAIQKALEEYGENIRKRWGVDFKMRIGLNSGLVLMGSVGNDLRMEYTAIGDSTNLASRMQSMAQPGRILASGHTYRLCKDYFEFKSLGKLSVKGKEEPQDAFELIQTGAVKTRIGASIAKGLTPFAGRTNSLAALFGPYEEVKAGTGQVVGIVGEPGVGKSRLLLEFRNRLPKDEFGYLEGRCLQYGSSMAYLPILDLLRGYFDLEAGEPEPVVREKLAGRIPPSDSESQGILIPIQDLLSLKVEDEAYLKLDPSQKKEKIFEALREWLVRESESKPLIIALEDLHWVDRTTEEFLRYLTGWVAKTKILLVLLYRPEYVPPWANQSNYHRIALNQLTPRSSNELVQAILEGGEVDRTVLDLILGKAGGNPLFMEELTGSLLENGSIQKEGLQYVLSKSAADIRVPDTIQGIMAARMDRLEESLKKVVQVASVIGREFAFRVLQAILETREELKPSLLNLQGLEYIYEKRLFPELEYIFKHALTQEVAYNSLLLKRRKEIHEKIGTAIEEIYPERLEEFYEMLAYQYSRSDNLEKACRYLKLSGQKSIKNHSLWEAFRFYRETIDALKQMPETEENKREQIEVILLLAIPMRHLAYPEDSLRFLQEGERLCHELGDRKSIPTLYSLMGLYYSVKGNPALGRKYQEDSFREAEKLQDIEIMAPVGFGLCFSYLVEGNNREIANIVSKVVALIEKMNRELEFFGSPYNLYAVMQGYDGLSRGALGEFAAGERFCEKGLAFARKINHIYTIAGIENLTGYLFSFKGDGPNVVKHMKTAIQYFEKSQSALLLPSAWSFLGYGHLLLGDPDTALKFINKGLKMHLDMGLSFLLSLHHCFLGFAHFDLGNLDEAEKHAGQGVKFAEANNEKYIEGFSRLQLGRTIGKMKGSPVEKAEESILKGMKILGELGLKPLYALGNLFLGELCANAAQKEKGLAHLEKAEEMFQGMGMDYWLGRTRMVLEGLQRE